LDEGAGEAEGGGFVIVLKGRELALDHLADGGAVGVAQRPAGARGARHEQQEDGEQGGETGWRWHGISPTGTTAQGGARTQPRPGKNDAGARPWRSGAGFDATR